MSFLKEKKKRKQLENVMTVQFNNFKWGFWREHNKTMFSLLWSSLK